MFEKAVTERKIENKYKPDGSGELHPCWTFPKLDKINIKFHVIIDHVRVKGHAYTEGGFS